MKVPLTTSDQLTKELYDNLKETLFEECIKTCFFSFIPDNFTEQYNYRSSLFLGNFIKDFAKDKHFCHVGCAEGDLDLIISKYAKKITMIEKDRKRFRGAKRKNRDGLYSCPTEVILDDFCSLNIQADVFFVWCGYKYDRPLLEHIMKTNSKCIIISSDVLEYHKEGMQIPNLSKYMVPFDENFDLSYYANKMMKRDDILIVTNEYIFRYSLDYKFIEKIENKNFDFDGYEDYQHEYLQNETIQKVNQSPATKYTDGFHSFKRWLQHDMRGYTAIGVFEIN